ncbi:hypothetical protein [Myxacorys almedinensis]|nr:hypothetical protein [Myxacorys almedinensis]
MAWNNFSMGLTEAAIDGHKLSVQCALLTLQVTDSQLGLPRG